MPPRKKQNVARAGPSSAPSFDRSRFRSEIHEQRFINNVSRRDLIRERGFDFVADEFPEFQNQIQMRNWGILCGNPGVARQTIVKEFYANAFLGPDQEKTFKSFVRGREVDFSARTINQLIGDTEIRPSQCKYTTRLARGQRPTEMLRDLCREGAEWEFDGKGNPKLLKKSDFKPIPSVWCTFVQAKLLPVSNHSQVIVRRALLVHCILESELIDVGMLIANNIHQIAHESHTKLGHPSLITQLCEQAGVATEGDLPHQPEWPINADFIRRVEEEFKGKYGEGNDEQAAAQPPPHPQASGSGSRRQRTNKQRLERMEDLLCQHIRQNEKKFDYVINSLQGLEGMNRRLAEQLNLDPDSLGGLPVPDEDVMAHINFDEDDEEGAEEMDDEEED